MIDPRKVLENELLKLGVDDRTSKSISLDTGSSQCVVNKEYLNDIILDFKLMEKVYQKVIEFYSGDLIKNSIF